MGSCNISRENLGNFIMLLQMLIFSVAISMNFQILELGLWLYVIHCHLTTQRSHVIGTAIDIQNYDITKSYCYSHFVTTPIIKLNITIFSS